MVKGRWCWPEGDEARERVLSMAPVKSEVERIVTEREREAKVVSIRQS